MALAERLGRLGRLSLEERRFAVRQIHAEIVEPRQLAADDPVGLANVRLRVTGPEAQQNTISVISLRRSGCCVAPDCP